MESLLNYIEELEDLLENGKANMLSKRISVDRDKIYDILSDIRLNLPNEMRQAQRIVEDHERIIEEAKSKALTVIREAEIHSAELVNEHAVTKAAEEQAREIMDDAKKQAREMRMGAYVYADDILATVENTVRSALDDFVKKARETESYLENILEVLYENRQTLRDEKG